MSESRRWLPHLLHQIELVIPLALLVAFIAISVISQRTHWAWVPTSAETLSAAKGALKEGDYKGAADLFAALANKNDPSAQYWMAHMKELGLGVPRDTARALTLYQEAATRNVTAANLRLGEIYLQGNLVPPDFGQARTYLARAADSGDAEAARLLGKMYRYGLGTAADPKEAFAWSEVAAIEGNVPARRSREQLLHSLSPTDQRAAVARANDILGAIGRSQG